MALRAALSPAGMLTHTDGGWAVGRACATHRDAGRGVCWMRPVPPQMSMVENGHLRLGQLPAAQPGQSASNAMVPTLLCQRARIVSINSAWTTFASPLKETDALFIMVI